LLLYFRLNGFLDYPQYIISWLCLSFVGYLTASTRDVVLRNYLPKGKQYDC